MRKLFLSIAAGLFLFAGAYNYAKADECKTLSLTDVQAQVGSAGDEAKIITVTPDQLKVLFDSKGPPPNTDMDKPTEARLVVIGGFGKLFLFQDNCATVSIGPMPLERLFLLLGLVQANG